MSEMVERVALALQRIVQERGGKPIPGFMANHMAAAAIQAMREPTPAMWEAVEAAKAEFESGIAWPIMIDEALK